MDTRRTVASPALLDDRFDCFDEDGCCGGTLGPSIGRVPPSIKPRPGDADDGAQPANGMLGDVGGDEGKPRGHGFPAQCAKKAEAFRRISFSS
jgi:hypothetical protein